MSRAYNAMAGLVVVAKTPHAGDTLNTLLSQREHRERLARAAAANGGCHNGSVGRLGIVTTFRGLVTGRVPGDLSIRLPPSAGSAADSKYERMTPNTIKDIERLRLDRSVTGVKVLGVTASNSCGAITTIEATCAGHPNKCQHRILLGEIGYPVVGNVGSASRSSGLNRACTSP